MNIIKKYGQISVWFRESTNEWIAECVIDIPNEFHGNYRYPAKDMLDAMNSMYENIIDDINSDIRQIKMLMED